MEKAKRKPERHGMRKTRLYDCWRSMKKRVNGNPDNVWHRTHPHYDGLTVCEEWANSFTSFMAWALTHGYAAKLTLDRTDNRKGYYPENCRWATPKEQSQNTCATRPVRVNGKDYPSMSEAARQTGISRRTLDRRIKRGLVTPLKRPYDDAR
ncbi:MAG: helix-turn-helix domain-containing protein [Kiritimatiellae bacterium]|nr:helix-turn-helix domain-containing protein [Kiritimatiellia bacterium]